MFQKTTLLFLIIALLLVGCSHKKDIITPDNLNGQPTIENKSNTQLDEKDNENKKMKALINEKDNIIQQLKMDNMRITRDLNELKLSLENEKNLNSKLLKVGIPLALTIVLINNIVWILCSSRKRKEVE